MSHRTGIRVVAAVVVRNDGKILCARSGNSKNPCVAWKWEFPGGKIDADETPENALARELLEEMDFPVLVGEKITTVCHAYPNCEIEMDAFLCTPAKPVADFVLREHIEACWLKPEELPKLDWADADKPIVSRLLPAD